MGSNFEKGALPAIGILIDLENLKNFFGKIFFEKNVISTPEGPTTSCLG